MDAVFSVLWCEAGAGSSAFCCLFFVVPASVTCQPPLLHPEPTAHWSWNAQLLRESGIKRSHLLASKFSVANKYLCYLEPASVWSKVPLASVGIY